MSTGKGNEIIQAERLEALDVFRGFTIALMILVNTPGCWSCVYGPLKHANWHGCTLTDLVFPFFLFITGAAMRYSFKKYDYRLSHGVILKVLKRVVLIFLIGLALNFFPFQIGLDELRMMGVLQRIALAYGIAAFICLTFNRQNIFFISLLLLIAYWFMLVVFGHGNPYALESNVVRFVDLAVLGEKHLWHGKVLPFEPEGILSTLPAVVSVLFGYLAGSSLQSQTDLVKSLRRMSFVGVAAIVTGMAWGLVFPINKYLWSSSYVVYTSGWAMVILSICIYIIDVRGYRRWSKPFNVLGLNPLFIYVLSIVWVKILMHCVIITKSDGSVISGYQWMFSKWFLPLAGCYGGSLLFAMANVVLSWMIALLLFRKKIFVSL
jgi:predicted acyltransferase